MLKEKEQPVLVIQLLKKQHLSSKKPIFSSLVFLLLIYRSNAQKKKTFVSLFEKAKIINFFARKY